jgi:DNA-binding PadR family transcriptional regulator
MPLQHAVLALLAEGPSYGYELKAMFEEAIGPQWGELNIGHLYQVLDRLDRAGQVTSTRVEQATRPDRNIYELTPPGETELLRWAAEPHIRQSGHRDELFLKLFAASRLGDDVFGSLISAQRAALVQELATLAKLERDHADEPLVAVLIEAATLHTRADYALLESAERRLAPKPAAAASKPAAQRRRRAVT